MIPLPIILVLLAAGIGLTLMRWLRTREASALYGLGFFVVLTIARFTPGEGEWGWIAWAIDFLVIAAGTAYVVSATRKRHKPAAPRPTTPPPYTPSEPKEPTASP